MKTLIALVAVFMVLAYSAQAVYACGMGGGSHKKSKVAAPEVPPVE